MNKAFIILIFAAFVGAAQAGEFAGTTYKLGQSKAEVFQPVNGSGFDLTLYDKAYDIALYASDGSEVGINSSYSFWGGEHVYRITFNENLSGNLTFSMPYHGQQFVLPQKNIGPVRVILPPGYTTGDRLLGIARPVPDEVKTDRNGTELIWYSPPEQLVEVSYYSTDAPESLKKIFAFLAALAAILLIEHFASMRRLRSVSRESDKRV